MVTAVYAFVHAAMQRSDAYTAADKLTKPVWLLILGVAVAMASILSQFSGSWGWRSRPARPACIWSTCGPNFSRFRASRANAMKALVAARRSCSSLGLATRAGSGLRGSGHRRAGRRRLPAVHRPHRMGALGVPEPHQPAGLPDAVRARRRQTAGDGCGGRRGLGRSARRCRPTPTPPACALSSSATGNSPKSRNPARPAGTSSRGGRW